MLIKRLILKKVLNSGEVAEFLLIKEEGEFQAALFVDGKHIHGPTLPQPLTQPKGEITHWMGNKPGVGLTLREAERILNEVEVENGTIRHRQCHGWD